MAFFVLFLVLLLSFLAVPIHLMMHKSLSLNRAGPVNFHHAACGSLCIRCVWFLFVCFFVCFGFWVCFLFFFRHRDDPIELCKGPPTVRPLLVHLFTKMAEFTTALINGQHAACNSVLIDLAKAKRRWTEKNWLLMCRHRLGYRTATSE